MKKLLTLIVALTMLNIAGNCLAQECECSCDCAKKSVFMEKVEDSTQSAAEVIGEKSAVVADKTGKAIKKGAKKTGEAVKCGANKAGKATKKGAKKATNWSARKIRNGAEQIIIKTEDSGSAKTENTAE